MAPRLKVFATRIGFNEVIVAVSSQKAALAAWDVKANLFAKGLAAETQDTAAVEAAFKTPGEALIRPAGTKKPYTRAPAFPMKKPVPVNKKEKG